MTAAEYSERSGQRPVLERTGLHGWRASFCCFALNALGTERLYNFTRVGHHAGGVVGLSSDQAEELTGTFWSCRPWKKIVLSAIVDYSADVPDSCGPRIHRCSISRWPRSCRPNSLSSLIETESSFRRHAVSEAGAIGYTQIKPSTARWLDPGGKRCRPVRPRDEPAPWIHVPPRVLLEEYDQDMRLALLAYNRGPGRVRAPARQRR